MKVLKQISDKQAEYYRYQAREDYLRLQESLTGDLEEAQLKCDKLEIQGRQDKTKIEQQNIEVKESTAAAEQEKVKAEQEKAR